MCAQTGSQTRQHPLSKGTEFDASLSASQTILRKPIETKVNFQYIETARAKKKHLQLNKRLIKIGPIFPAPITKTLFSFISSSWLCSAHPINIGDYSPAAAASASQVLTSAEFGIRPELTTFSLITSPGVDRMFYDTILLKSVTLIISAASPIISTAWRVMASTFLQFGQPEPKTLIVNIY